MVGQSLRHYEVMELLGSGAMGRVYRARDTILKRDVAIKVLPADVAEDGDRLARLQREAQLLAAVNHPNIASIYNLEEEGNDRFLVLELVEGESLDDMLSHPLPVATALDLCGQIAEALDAAHRAGIIHRDLKPANIMVTGARRIKVLDFGIAKTVEDICPGETAKLTRLTETGMIVGTSSYMSPEQVRAQPLETRTDVWAFGCVLYETLTGKRAFGRETVGDTLSAILEHEPDWSALPGDTPPAVESLLRRCLQKDLQLRLRDIGDAWVEINAVSAGATAARPGVVAGGNPQGGSRIRLVHVAGALALVAAAAALTMAIQTFAGPSASTEPLAPSHRQITFVGDATDAAISPDGRSIAYVTGTSGQHQRLMLTDLAGGQAIEILDGSSVMLPVWSPDGSALTVSAVRDQPFPTRVYRVPRLGGEPRRLGAGVFTTWSPDGSRIAIALQNRGFWVFSEATGESVRIPMEGYDWNRGLVWSPTGDRLALMTNSSDSGVFEIFTVDPSGNDRRPVAILTDPLSSPRWSPRGDAIYFLRHRNNVADLLRVALSQAGDPLAEPAVVLSGLPATEAVNSTFNMTADGRSLAYSTRLEYANLWLGERTGGGPEQAYETRALTGGTSLIERPSISPDGRWIAYSAQTSTGANIFKMPIGGGNPVQLTFSDAYQTSPAWAPDGGSIAFTARDADGAKVWMMRSDGTEQRGFPQTDVSSTGMRIVWSPGDRPLYQRPGNQNFFYLDVETGEQEPMVPDAAFERRADEHRGFNFYPQFSPDGKHIAITWNRLPAQALWLITRQPYSERTVNANGSLSPIGWSADAEWIFVVPLSGVGSFVGRVAVAGGDLDELFALPGGVRSGSVGPGGDTIVATVGAVQSDVFVVEDFDRRHR